MPAAIDNDPQSVPTIRAALQKRFGCGYRIYTDGAIYILSGTPARWSFYGRTFYTPTLVKLGLIEVSHAKPTPL